jgi:uncharacterized protein (DUF2267 family)
MKYRELIKRVQHDSGFSDAESQDALQLMVEALAVRLTEGERKDFASQLPAELKGIALTVQPTEENRKVDMLEQFMVLQGINEKHAMKQIKVTWHVLKKAISPGEVEDIKAQLNTKTVALLG